MKRLKVFRLTGGEPRCCGDIRIKDGKAVFTGDEEYLRNLYSEYKHYHPEAAPDQALEEMHRHTSTYCWTRMVS